MVDFDYPIAAKPDVGQMGLMFRKIESHQQLKQYHEAMKVDYIIQEFIDYPLEVSVFYYRLPGEANGHITGFIRKEYLQVIGDGRSTLRNLILNYQRAQFLTAELLSKHQSKLDNILKEDESFILSDALNLSRGGRLVNLNHEIDQQLLSVFDELSHHTNFYYGRYDIKCSSIEALKQKKNFSILEFNGSVRPWGSWFVGINSIERTRIARKFFLEWGFGVSWYNFKFENDKLRMAKDAGGVIFSNDQRDVDFIKSKLTATYINASFVPVIDFGGHSRKPMIFTGMNGDSFRIGVGPYAGYRIDSYTKLVFKEDGDKHRERDHDSYYLNNLRYGLRLQVGFGATDLFFNYDMNEVFATNKGPQLHSFSFGLTF
ncbi:MAG: hypothetical protein WDO15_20550 [Bacteroidota bacterium]